MTDREHWRTYLVREFPPGEESTVDVRINPSTDSAAMVLVLSRLAGIVAALREIATDDADPLEREDPEDLYLLLDHLHQARVVIQGQEERVLELAHRMEISTRRLASALELSSPQSVLNRIKRIRHDAGTSGQPVTNDE